MGDTPHSQLNPWRSALLQAAPITLFLLGVFYYWFALANRYVIFLYGHLNATPFDERTRSRYWMSGLVACGALMVLDMVANWFAGRIAGIRNQRYIPPAWWRVWLLCLVPLALGIPAITMNLNQPTLGPADTAALVAATSTGLALALAPRRLAAGQPAQLAWLTLAGLGLVPSLLFLRVVELPAAGLATTSQAYSLAFGGTLAGTIWLVFVSWLWAGWRRLISAWGQRTSNVFPSLASRRKPASDGRQNPAAVVANEIGGQTQDLPLPNAAGGVDSADNGFSLFVAGLCLSYLLLPLVHHTIMVPPSYRYISASTNFFAMHGGLQLVSFLVAAVLAMGNGWLGRRFRESPHPFQPG